MGSDNFRQVGTFDFTEGIGTSVSGTASSFSCSNQSVSDKGFSKESVVTKRSEHSDSEGCFGGGKSSFSSRVLFPAVLGTQEERENETGSRSFCSQSVSGGPTFQNGDQQVYQVDNSFRNLDNLSRFDGRLFSHPYFSQVSSFPETGVGRQGLQFQGYAFWPGYCTPSFYQDFSDGGVVSSYSGSSHSFLPRRFSHQESLPFSFGGTHQFVYPFTPETGFFDFMGKIRDNSQSEFQFPGRTFSDRFGSSASSRREGSQGMSVSQCSDSVFICPSSSIASAGGFLDFDHGRHSTRTSTHSSNPVVSDGVLASNFSVVGGTCSHPSSVVTSSSMVASGKTSSEGSFVGSSRPQPNFVHRCESDGLGSLSGGQDSIRSLVRCSVGGTHQSSRDESCVSFSPSVSGCDSGSVTTGCHGQLHSSGLSSESRRDPFLFSVSSEQGNSSSVSQSQYFSVSETCSRQSKSSGGCSLPFPCSSEHRMGNSSISVSGDHSSLGSSSYRSFCHQSESQIGDLRFSHSRRESLGSRCYDPILEGNVQLHVPSFSSSSKDLAQDSEGSLQDHSYCSGLVKTVLVPRTTTSVLCEAPLFASKRGSTVSIQRKKTASRSGESPSARLVVVRDSLRKGGFSEGATKRISGSVRQSTGAVYDSKWSIFCTWCLSKQINPLSVTVQQLADFFLYLFEEKGYSPSTIKGYRSAIARTISLSGGSDFGDNEFLSLMIKNFCLNRPRQRRLVPSWDLGLVLKVLQFSPFEPLHSASFKFLSYKCCFLIALATGRRRSEIHALSISESCLRFASDKSSVTLLTDPSFLAKNQLPDKGSGIITIPALPPTSDNQVLCPVRALLVYLASSAKLRSAGSSRLFIPIKKGISDISAKTISTWICNTVILAYKSASSEVLVKHQVKAHEVRALASSWNIFNSSSMSEIMSAGFWRSDSAFYNHYLRSMPLHCDNLYSLGPLVAAQQVVFPPPSDGDSALR
ncbi:serine-rich adhesin for platelets-like [Mytilus edulis]|uniref:serine-rich adhesin for platelets-like n=1 Tax=Mytilus edulis TaxID=6550 RepID=UPI0039F0C369